MVKIEISKAAAEKMATGLMAAEMEARRNARDAAGKWEKRSSLEKAEVYQDLREVVLEAIKHEYFPKA